jgi:predicted Zn finger-like uncharacterized protein
MLTRCPKCETTFQLNAAQLNARGGLVRCGHCRKVFNARWNLLDQPRKKKPAGKPGRDHDFGLPDDLDALGTDKTGKARNEPRLPKEDWSWEMPWDDSITTDAQPSGEESLPAEEELTAPVEPEETEFDPFSHEPDEEIVLDSGPEMDVPELHELAPEETKPAAAPPAAAAKEPRAAAPGPGKRERQRPRSRSRSATRSKARSGARRGRSGTTVAGWLFGSILLILIAAAQVGYFYFQELAQIPTTRDILGWACQYLGCSLPPRQQLDHIELVRSQISYPETGADRLFIDVDLVNRAGFEQPYPVLEVTLTNRLGQIVARRNFTPREYLHRSDAGHRRLPVQVAMPLHLAITSPANTVTGYEIRLLPAKTAPVVVLGDLKNMLRSVLQ